MKTYAFMISAASLLFAGCIPIPIPHSGRVAPAFTGRVVNADTQKPIEGVSVTQFRYETAELVFSVLTDTNGRYKTEKKELKWFYPLWLGPAEGIKGGIIEFRKTGYVDGTQQRRRFTGANSYPTFEVNYALQKEK